MWRIVIWIVIANICGSVDRRKKHSRFFISVGLMDGLDKGSLLRIGRITTNLEGSNIGRIELKHSFSFL